MLVLLALVVLLHQPIWLLTQYLIARGRQRAIARTLLAGAGANIVLSVVLASTVGIWGVALSTLSPTRPLLVLAVPLWVTPASGLRAAAVARALARPAVPALGVAVVVFGSRGRCDTRHAARARAGRRGVGLARGPCGLAASGSVPTSGARSCVRRAVGRRAA